MKRISPSTIDAIFLDVGGTILRPKGSIGSSYSECLASYGIDADAGALDQAFGIEFQRRKEAARRFGGTAYGSTQEQAEAFWKEVFFSTVPEEVRSHDCLEKAFEAIYAYYGRAEAWELFDDTLPFLQAVQDLGIPLIIVSNWDARLPRLLKSLGVIPWVTEVIGSYQLNAEKPDRKVFAAALGCLSVPLAPERVIHIGDNQAEDGGAENLGIKFIRVERSGEAKHPHEVDSLMAILPNHSA